MSFRKTIHLFLLPIMVGCAHKSEQQRLVDYINDPANKIVQSIHVGNTIVTTKLLPGSYRNISAKLVSDSVEDDYTYFNVKLENDKSEKPANSKLLYLNFDIQHDFTLLYGKDSIPASICQRIENGKEGSYEYIVAFENNKVSNKDFSLFYDDKVFGIGTVAFVYLQRDIMKIPTIKTLAIHAVHF